MKKFTKNIKKLYKAIDVSPFAYSKLKVIIFIIWGLNALVFLSKDSVSNNTVSPEQLSVVSREFFDYNILPDSDCSIKVDIIPFVAGIIIESEISACTPELNLSNSDRAPPEIS